MENKKSWEALIDTLDSHMKEGYNLEKMIKEVDENMETSRRKSFLNEDFVTQMDQLISENDNKDKKEHKD